MKSLFLAFVEEKDGDLSKNSLEALGAATAIPGELTVGLAGDNESAILKALENIGSVQSAKFIFVKSAELAEPRYASDIKALQTLAKSCSPDIIIAPASARISRVIAGLSARLGGAVDSQVTDLAMEGDNLAVTRWFYRQRMTGKISRTARPWCITISSGCFEPFVGEASKPAAEEISLAIEDSEKKVQVIGKLAPSEDEQTIRPEAELLLVAGAGWTKKQPSGAVRTEEASSLILEFVGQSGASLGSSKSLVDISGEGQSVLPFLSHLHQVGQTGSTPRHSKGLATCCHGEEPHAVGWRFINERRAINLDAACGWAQGKADVLYVADAFEVMTRINELLTNKS